MGAARRPSKDMKMVSSVWRCCPGGSEIVSGSFDNTLKVWRLADGSCEKTLQGHEDDCQLCGGAPRGGAGHLWLPVTRASRSGDWRTGAARRPPSKDTGSDVSCVAAL